MFGQKWLIQQKIEEKAIKKEEGEEVEEEEDSSIKTDNLLEGDVSSPFAAESVESDEKEIAGPSKVVPQKLDEAIMKQTSSSQKRAIKNLFQTENFGKSYDSNARLKPIIFIPEKGDPIAYQSMSAMTRVAGLSKAKLIGKSTFKAMGDIKRSSSAMNKAGLKGVLVSVDEDMLMAMQLTPLSGRVDKVRRNVLEASIPEAPTGKLSKKSTTVEKSQKVLTAAE